MAGASVRTLPTPLTLDDFDVGVTLGTGSFGRVRFATHKVLLQFQPLALFSLFINHRRLDHFGQ
jgi:hypothetical protein